MANSISQSTSLPCRNCRKIFNIEVWLIIDVEERIDLKERIKNKKINEITCPHCGDKGIIDVPLLIFQKKAKNKLIFSPSSHTSKDEDRKHIRNLLSMLPSSIKGGLDDKSINEMLIIPREFLGGEISGVSRLGISRPTNPQDHVNNLLKAASFYELFARLLKPKDLAEAKQILDQHPELLTKDAETLLDQMEEVIHKAANQESIEQYAKLRTLLNRCREIGVKEAIAEISLSNEIEEQTGAKYRPEELRSYTNALNALSTEHKLRLRKIVTSSKNEDEISRKINQDYELSSALNAAMSMANGLESVAIPQELLNDFQAAKQAEEKFIHTRAVANLNVGIQKWQDLITNPRFDVATNDFKGMVYNDAALSYSHRYEVVGDRPDLDKSILFWGQSLNFLTSSLQKAIVLNNIGAAFMYSHRLDGQPELLEKGIASFREANQLLPSSHKMRYMILDNLGSGLHVRYAQKGNLSDLEDAISIWQEAFDVAPSLQFENINVLSNLSTGLRDLYFITRNPDLLNRAISYFRKSLRNLSKESRHYAGVLSNLGLVLVDRYIHLGDDSDLNQAILNHQQAIEHTHPDAPELPVRMNNYCIALFLQYKNRGGMDTLNTLISTSQKASDIAVRQPSVQTSCLATLARALRQKYLLTNDPSNMTESREKSRMACTLSLELNRTIALGISLEWGKFELENKQWKDASEAFGYGLDVVAYLFKTQPLRKQKEVWLKEAQELPSLAAYALAKSGNLIGAVDALESGRAYLLTEAIEQNRRDLDRLPSLGFGDFLQTYYEAVNKLNSLQSQLQQRNFIQSVVSPISESSLVSELLYAHTQLDDIIFKIQKIPGYEDFFKSFTFNKVQQVANNIPLTYLLYTPLGGIALFVKGETVNVIDLPELSDASLKEQVYGNDTETAYLNAYMSWRKDPGDEFKLYSWKTKLEQTTHWLWNTIMSKIVDCMHQTGDSDVVIIPTGLLSLLPLHAAWRDQMDAPTGRRYALDDIGITYTPTARTLHFAMLGENRSVNKLLAVENPDGSLIFSHAETVFALDGFPINLHLSGKLASIQNVKSEISNAGVLHFSTHGMAGWENAEEASLLLADGFLTLRDVFDLNLNATRLAILSACETSVPGLKLPEEVISLPSGLMQAGVPGVIGSLWAVNDMSTAILISYFYHLWKKKGLQPKEALRQAQIWLRDSTIAEKKLLFKELIKMYGSNLSANSIADFYRYIGWNDPGELLFAHPFFWAAFEYTGI